METVESTNKLTQQFALAGRRSGRNMAMAKEVQPRIEVGDRVFITGCKVPDTMLRLLAALGTPASAEPVYATPLLEPIYDEDGYVLGFSPQPKRLAGHVFFKNTQ